MRVTQMRINENTKIVGEKIILVPYRVEHVLKYHNWMQNAELQELTASEPLTLESEYEMQKSWREDEDKCTFIILDKEDYEETKDEVVAMIGDVNLFILDEREAEVEIMIAEEKKRKKGMGKEALLCMLRYGIEELKVTSYFAKIKRNNTISIHMFEKIGFVKCSESDIFQEITLECLVDDHFYNDLLEWTVSYRLQNL